MAGLVAWSSGTPWPTSTARTSGLSCGPWTYLSTPCMLRATCPSGASRAPGPSCRGSTSVKAGGGGRTPRPRSAASTRAAPPGPSSTRRRRGTSTRSSPSSTASGERRPPVSENHRSLSVCMILCWSL
ncbi:adenosine 5'-phosphosulfate reductase-like1 [Zea mays]|uniref:Adenosine 5'-phosphosulfate reductase-like1 n=1 Tax=Zea mays TaxID=4577 RepID=A0A1D6ICL5_MAIZE|nr:adenosine 5'-phosphosulfate reductase-like1 [Zea mays]